MAFNPDKLDGLIEYGVVLTDAGVLDKAKKIGADAAKVANNEAQKNPVKINPELNEKELKNSIDNIKKQLAKSQEQLAKELKYVHSLYYNEKIDDAQFASYVQTFIASGGKFTKEIKDIKEDYELLRQDLGKKFIPVDQIKSLESVLFEYESQLSEIADTQKQLDSEISKIEENNRKEIQKTTDVYEEETKKRQKLGGLIKNMSQKNRTDGLDSATELLGYSSSINGYTSDINVSNLATGITKEFKNEVFKQITKEANDIDTQIHSHPTNEIAAASWDDIGVFIKDMESGIQKQAVSSLSQVMTFDFSNTGLPQEELKEKLMSILKEYKEYYFKYFSITDELGNFQSMSDFTEDMKEEYNNALKMIEEMFPNVTDADSEATQIMFQNKLRELFNKYSLQNAINLTNINDIGVDFGFDEIIKAANPMFHVFDSASKSAKKTKQDIEQLNNSIQETLNNAYAEGQDSNSPSKDFEKLENDAVDGIVKGEEENRDRLVETGKDMASAVKEGYEEEIQKLEILSETQQPDINTEKSIDDLHNQANAEEQVSDKIQEVTQSQEVLNKELERENNILDKCIENFLKYGAAFKLTDQVNDHLVKANNQQGESFDKAASYYGMYVDLMHKAGKDAEKITYKGVDMSDVLLQRYEELKQASNDLDKFNDKLSSIPSLNKTKSKKSKKEADTKVETKEIEKQTKAVEENTKAKEKNAKVMSKSELLEQLKKDNAKRNAEKTNLSSGGQSYSISDEFKVEQQTVSSVVDSEKSSLSDLENQVHNVTTAIQAKTKKIVEEENQMRESVGKEIASLKHLKDEINDVKKGLKDIGVIKITTEKETSNNSSSSSSSNGSRRSSSQQNDLSEVDQKAYIEMLKQAAEYEQKENDYIRQRNEALRDGAKQVKEYENAVKKHDSIIFNYESQLSQIKAASNGTKEYTERIELLENAIEQYKVIDFTRDDQKQSLIDTEKSIKNLINGFKQAKEVNLTGIVAKYEQWLQKNTAATKETREQVRLLINELNDLDTPEFRKNQIVAELNRITGAAKSGASVVDMLKARWKSLAAYLGSFASFYKIVGVFKTVFSTVQELDYALVDVKKTFKGSNAELEQMYSNSANLAKQLGVTTKEIIEQEAAWSRLGYSSRQDAEEMAKLSSQFAAISPGMDVDKATDGLVSNMKAFKVEVGDVQREIMDNINRIGNTMATSNEEIVEMLTRSSAAMAAANNTIQETIALESAAVQITRNAETTGTAFRTISMRIRGLDEETEEASEELENITGKIADLTKTAKTPGGISLFTDKDKTTYKSTYEILKEISAVYHDLTDKQQADLLEVLAGKRGGQVLAGLLDDFSEVERAMGEMKNAAGK